MDISSILIRQFAWEGIICQFWHMGGSVIDLENDLDHHASLDRSIVARNGAQYLWYSTLAVEKRLHRHFMFLNRDMIDEGQTVGDRLVVNLGEA